MKENCVVFKGGNEGISVILSENESFEVIKQELYKKIENAGGFFDGASSSISIKGKELTPDEEIELIQIIADKTNLNVTFVKSGTSDSDRFSAVLTQKIADCMLTKFHKGSIRSGQAVVFNGSVVVEGDVNPGGEVKASGNIIVLGQLKGLAHAGVNGDASAYVTSLSMTPVQLRIADKITVFPENRQRNERVVEKAYIEDGQICVIPLN